MRYDVGMRGGNKCGLPMAENLEMYKFCQIYIVQQCIIICCGSFWIWYPSKFYSIRKVAWKACRKAEKERKLVGACAKTNADRKACKTSDHCNDL